MKIPRPALLPFLIAALCGSLAACANAPADRWDWQTRGGPPTTSQTSYSSGNAKPALTIQSGEGEKLYLPWFVRDVQDWVNQRGTPGAAVRQPGNP